VGGSLATEPLFAIALGLSRTPSDTTSRRRFAAVVLYRGATFYIPPVWGFLAMRWLRRNALL